MDLRQTKPIIITALIASMFPLVFGSYTYLESPQGILLYTPVAGHPHPKGTPAFPIGVVVGLAVLFLLSLLFVGQGGIAACIARSSSSKVRVKFFCKIAVTTLIASIAGAVIYAMLSQ
ncbi:hypothetical protein [Aquipseudomonas campi]